MRVNAVDQRYRGTANFIDFGIIRNNAHAEVVGRLIQELQPAADAVTIVVKVLTQRKVIDVAVALGVENRAAHREVVGQ